MDPDADSGGPKTYGSYGSGSATLVNTNPDKTDMDPGEPDPCGSTQIRILTHLCRHTFKFFIVSQVQILIFGYFFIDLTSNKRVTIIPRIL